MFKKEMKKLRTAFSMLELIFVIVILGIVASMSAEIIANIYENYIVQRAHYRASIKVENTLTQISNRLTNAIPGTTVRRIGLTGTAEDISTPPISGSTDSYTVLQWVAKDVDSFTAITAEDDRLPGWSGFCDLDASTVGTTVSTSGSKLSLADDIIKNLSANTKDITNATIFFSGYRNENNISSISGDVITLSATPAQKVEHYKLAWTSYALSVEGGDLYLYHNFAPIPATTIDGTRTLLLKNITHFKFRGDGRTIRIKFCVNEKIEDGDIPSCAERVIF